MPYGYRPQRPGGIDPNDPRKKRLPLTPEEDPYGGIVSDFEVDLPEPASPLPQVPLTQPSTIGMQTGAKLPMEQWQTPPRDLTSLRAWYSGAAEVSGAPPAPEWGKRTPTYSRLNPPPPRQMQAPTPAPSPTAPVGPLRAPAPNLFGQLPSEQFGQRMQQLGVSMQPAASPPVTPPAAGSGRQAFNQFMQSLGTGVAGIPRGVAAALEETLGAGNVVPEQWRARTSPIQQPRAVSTALQAPTRAAEQQVRQAFPVNPQDQSWLTSKIPAGLGSAGAFVASAAAGRALGVPANVTTATAGTGMAVNQFLNEIEQTGIDPRRYTAGVNLATVSGLSELVGFGRLLDKFGMKRRIVEQGLDILQDSGQEAFQGFLEDLNAKLVAANDPSRNIDPRSSDFWLKRGEEAALGAIVSAPLAGINIATDKIRERRTGGADKVPDALQTETGPAVQPPTGQFGGVIPPSAERQAYETWTQAGGPRAPEAYQVLRKSRSLPGRLGLPPVGLPPVGMPEGQAPQRPTTPLGAVQPPPVTPRTQPPVQPAPETVTETEGAPFTFRPRTTVGRPEARAVLPFERPILQTALEGQAVPIAQRIEQELPEIRQEYAETGRIYDKKPRKGEVGEEGPTAGNVRGEYGKLAYYMHRTPSAVLKKAVSAYDLEPTEKIDDSYEPVMDAIVADMQQIVPGITASDVMASAQATAKAKRALPPEVTNIWESWYDQFGKDRGFTKSELSNLKELTAGRRGPFFRPDVQAVMGVDPGDVEANKQTQTAIRQDLARLMRLPYEEVSLTTVPPAIWQNWMSLRGLNNESQFPGFKAQMQEIFDRYNEEVRGVKPSPPSPPSAPAGAAPTAPTRPTPPPPAAPAAPTAPTAPSPLVTRYQSQVGRGVSRAPFAFQPRSYTEGVASMERARAEREEARQARERLKKGSPFARARQAEEARIGEVIEGRRPEPPAATEPVTPKPTPPAPPAPAGEAVTPPTPRKATPVKKESAPKPAAPTGQPITEKSLTEQGWTKNSSTDFSGPNGERLERDANRRGEPWVYTDRSGNTESFASAREAIQGILSRPAATPAPEAPVTPKTTKPRKAKAEAEAAPVPQTTQKESPESAVWYAMEVGKTIWDETARRSIKPDVKRLRAAIEEAKQKGVAVVKRVEREYESYELYYKQMPLAARQGKADWMKVVITISYPSLSVQIGSPFKTDTIPEGYKRQGEGGDAKYIAISEPATTSPAVEPTSKATPVPQTTQAEEGELPVAEFARQQEQVAARREAFLKDNPDLILTAEDYVKTLAPDVQQRYAKYKALQAKFEAAKQAGSQVRFGATSGKQLKELTRELEFISKEVGRAKGVLSAVIDREPVNASTVDALGIKLPKGYQRQGNQFVFEGEAAPATTAPEVPTEVRQIFDTLDSPQGKKSKTRKSVEAMNPNLGKKAIFVNDNIEQIIAEAEANGKVTKECP